MMSLFIIFLKSVFCSGLMLGYYALFLRNRKVHQFNRFYLLCTVVVGMVLPFLHFEWHRVSANLASRSVFHFLQTVNDPGNEYVPGETSSSAIQVATLLLSLYVIIGLSLVFRLVIKIRKVYNLIRRHKTIRQEDYYLIFTSLDNTPFSFFNFLFWDNTLDRESAAGRQILKHELVHIRQRHTMDKLFLQIVTAVFWINPFLWIIQKELSLLHEFIADDATVNDHNAETFARMLLQKHYGNAFNPVVHPFFQSPIKRRLIMLQQNDNLRYATLRKFMFLPILFTGIFLSSFDIHETTVVKANKKLVLALDAGHGGKDAGAKSQSGLTEKELTLKVTNKLAELANEYNIEVVKTRKSDEYPTLLERSKTANKSSAELFLSVHINVSENRDDRELPYEFIVNERNQYEDESKVLALSLASRFSEKEISPVLYQRHLVVLERAAMPAVLVELGNINNEKQMSVINRDKELERLCRNILSGVVDYQNKQ